MRPTRRALLWAGGAALAGAAIPALAQRPGVPDEPVGVAIRAYPLDHFAVNERDRRQFGALTFRSGLELQSSQSGFGGFSGLWRSPDGADLVLLSDNAQWITARLRRDGARLAGLADAVMAPVLGAGGRPLRRTRSYDTEALTIAGGTAYVGIERAHEVMRFDWGRDGIRARGQVVPVPAEIKSLPRNKGIEALGIAPPRHPLGGALVAIAEQAREGDAAPTRGFILSGSRRGAFDVARSDGFDVTDLAFLPSGEMLLLERRFSLLRGVAVRMRRIPPTAFAPGATLDGPVIFEAGGAHQVDNFEGLAVHREPGGETIVTLVSDDNFSSLQRTLLLEFALTGE